MTKTAYYIFISTCAILGVIAFIPSALTIFGPEMGFGVPRSSNIVFLVYTMPLAWSVGLTFFIKFIIEKVSPKYITLFLTLLFWLIPILVLAYL